ncbi:MAG: hypothetical protein U0932_17115 [Thiobacillus sp.]|nr:hypothetical protein [Thiobacillus sp.]
MNLYFAWRVRTASIPLLLLATLGVCGTSLAADPGRLFYTPEQRAQLEAARARNVTQLRQAAPDTGAPPPIRYDGVVIRSDGRVYEPYQVLRPSPAAPVAEEPTP